MLKDCNQCAWCTPKEYEQTSNKEPHICKKYNTQLFHGANTRIHDPRIKPCNKCLMEDKDELSL